MKDITDDFKRISNDIIKIECQLRQIQPELAVHIAEVQDQEKQQLELVCVLSFLAKFQLV